MFRFRPATMRSWIAGCAVLLGILAAAPPALAQVQAQDGADLNISPKRLVLGGASRAGVVYVFNRGTAGASYAIDLVDRVMLADGQIVPLDQVPAQPGPQATAAALASAKSIVTFSPRRVTLGPGESQTIRVRVLTPPDLRAGEYRTHLTVATLPPEDAGLTAEAAATADEGELAARVIALLALSIPVIVRHDTGPGEARIANAVLRRNTAGDAGAPPAIVDLTLERNGAGSIYGDLEVVARRGKGKPESIGAIKGIAVYAEIGQRTASVALTRAPAADETLEVRYTDGDGASARPLATADVAVR